MSNRFDKEVLKSAKNNNRIYKEILSKFEPVYLATKTGIIYDKGYKFLWDSDAHDRVVERIIRGLYYHHFNTILGSNVEVKTFWFSELSSVEQVFEFCPTVVIGTGEFIYKFGNSRDNPLESFWLFQFYNAHWSGGHTFPVSK